MNTPTTEAGLEVATDSAKVLVRQLNQAAWASGNADAEDSWKRQERTAAEQDRLLKEALAAIDQLRDSAIAREAATRAEVETLKQQLRDPVVVHVAMLRGEIARPSVADLMHLYPELGSESEALRAALADVVDTDWAYLGKDADTGNPDSLYSRIRRGRAALAARSGLAATSTKKD